MSVRVTYKELKENYVTFKIGYCQAQNLLNNKREMFYNSGVYGWNWTAYLCDKHNIAIVTGYRPRGDFSDYDLVKEYDEKAEQIRYNSDLKWLEREQLLQSNWEEFEQKLFEKWCEVRGY